MWTGTNIAPVTLVHFRLFTQNQFDWDLHTYIASTLEHECVRVCLYGARMKSLKQNKLNMLPPHERKSENPL